MSDRLAAIVGSCEELLRSPRAARASALPGFVLDYVDQTTSNEDLLSHLIAQSLMQRFDHGLIASKNVYVQRLEMSQTQMFYLMAEAVPFVFESHRVANQYLNESLNEARHATVVDLGVGHGTQLLSLLVDLSTSKAPLESLVIVAVDPVEENLQQTGRQLNALRSEFPFDVQYTPVLSMIEDFAEQDDLAEDPSFRDRCVVINSAYSFHHTHHAVNDGGARTQLLEKLARLEPAALTLVEPNANHDTENLLERLRQCWSHYSHVFDLVDEAPIEKRHKLGVKAHFFGREIIDLFGVEDDYRCERHETHDSWQSRLLDAGLQPLTCSSLEVSLPPYCDYRVEDGIVHLTYDDTTIVAVLAYGV